MRQPGAVGMSGPRRRLGRPGVSKPRHCRSLAPSGIRETAMIAPGPAMVVIGRIAFLVSGDGELGPAVAAVKAAGTQISGQGRTTRG